MSDAPVPEGSMILATWHLCFYVTSEGKEETIHWMEGDMPLNIFVGELEMARFMHLSEASQETE